MANFYTRIKIAFQKILYILSLSKPISRVIVFTSGLIILFILPTDKLHYLPIRSLYEQLGFTPYSSGITRATSRLLQGDFVGAWKFNHLVYIIIPLVLAILVKDLIILVKTKDFSL